MLNKILCFIGKHDWLYDNENCNHIRVCKRCDKIQQYTLVNMGMNKIWMTYNSTPMEQREDHTKCHNYHCDKLIVPAKSGILISPEGDTIVLCNQCYMKYFKRKQGMEITF